jgi:MerR family transcriptional regulator, redox-sensitive transcriptional activator SoxR
VARRSERVLTIGEVAERAGVATSTIRYYEAEGLIASVRTPAGHRRYQSDVLRRVSFIRTAQLVGLTLVEIGDALASLPDSRTPTARDWEKLARSWHPRLDERIAVLTRMRDQLGECIGCGCLSLVSCRLWNPDDVAAGMGDGPRYLLSDDRNIAMPVDGESSRQV